MEIPDINTSAQQQYYSGSDQNLYSAPESTYGVTPDAGLHSSATATSTGVAPAIDASFVSPVSSTSASSPYTYSNGVNGPQATAHAPVSASSAGAALHTPQPSPVYSGQPNTPQQLYGDVSYGSGAYEPQQSVSSPPVMVGDMQTVSLQVSGSSC